MSVSKREAPETMPNTRQDDSIESSAQKRSAKLQNDSIITGPPCQEFAEFSTGSGGFHTGPKKVHADKHYTSRERMREQQLARDYWRSEYGADAEHGSRGGVTWL